MPELPEVEHIARQLRDELVGRTIATACVAWPRSIAGLDPREFESRVAGQRVTEIGRRGKYLLVWLSGADVLAVHRRMSGNLIFDPPSAEATYIRVRFGLDDGRELAFSDPRKFGRLWLGTRADLAAMLGALGPEPLGDAFTPEALAARLRGRNRAIKTALLDQTVIAGLGNIYADEALFRAGIHPLRPAAALTQTEIAALHAGIQRALLLGIEHAGTTFGRHRDVYNQAGFNAEHLDVYRRQGQPCKRCGTAIARLVVAQRGTHVCPVCQPQTAASA
jgi:formamidopyrimidine-DNA glycosylase